MRDLLLHLEGVLLARFSGVDALLPGLSEQAILTALDRAKVRGDLDVVLTLFSWRNGCLSSTASPSLAGSGPGSRYRFLRLDDAIEQFDELKTAAKTVARLTGDPTHLLVHSEDYFPLFWDGATGYIAARLRGTGNAAVVLVDFEGVPPIRPCYDSFEEFVRDLIRVNEREDVLRCFSETGERPDVF